MRVDALSPTKNKSKDWKRPRIMTTPVNAANTSRKLSLLGWPDISGEEVEEGDDKGRCSARCASSLWAQSLSHQSADMAAA